MPYQIMPTTTTDIHPHIISNDPARYPLAPLGGHQSDWSRTRPVTVEQLVAAMDTSGVQKAAIVQASTCYGHDNSYVADAVTRYPTALPASSQSMCLRPTLLIVCASGSPGPDRHAPLYIWQHNVRTS
jgi:predicted TIM-barrel fold metal-dependent hydrolase